MISRRGTSVSISEAKLPKDAPTSTVAFMQKLQSEQTQLSPVSVVGSSQKRSCDVLQDDDGSSLSSAAQYGSAVTAVSHFSYGPQGRTHTNARTREIYLHK